MFEGSFTPGRFIIQRLVYVCHQNLIKIRLLKLQMQTLFINEAHNVWGIQRLVCLYVCHRNFITWGCKNQNTKQQIQTLLINEAHNVWGILHTRIYNSAACLYLYVVNLPLYLPPKPDHQMLRLQKSDDFVANADTADKWSPQWILVWRSAD